MAADLRDGKEPEAPNSMDYWAQVVARSGAFGLFGDVVAQEMQGATAKDKVLGALKGIAGPMITKPLELGALGVTAMQEAAQPVPKYPKVQVLNAIQGLIPGNNLPYTKWLFNYYLMNSIKESMDAGFVYNLERQQYKHTGISGGPQRYLFGRPSEGVIR